MGFFSGRRQPEAELANNRAERYPAITRALARYATAQAQEAIASNGLVKPLVPMQLGPDVVRVARVTNPSSAPSDGERLTILGEGLPQLLDDQFLRPVVVTRDVLPRQSSGTYDPAFDDDGRFSLGMPREQASSMEFSQQGEPANG